MIKNDMDKRMQIGKEKVMEGGGHSCDRHIDRQDG